MKALAPIRPNAGTEALYRRKLQALVQRMHVSALYWVRAAYRRNEPMIAQDEALPSVALKRRIRELARRWQKQFNASADELAKYFTQAAAARSASQLQRILKDAGFTVNFTMTRTVRDVMNAAIAEQVSLIRSIPQQYFKDVEGAVMRSVQTGRDLGALTKELESTYGVTHRRAALLARDQNNKATATITRARHIELGITKAIWLHSAGGKTPRKTHLAQSGKEYDVDKGWFDPDANGKGKGAWIHPGQLISCRCVSRPVIKGFT